MASRYKTITAVTALFLAFAVTQVYVAISFAQPSSAQRSSAQPSFAQPSSDTNTSTDPPTGILTARGIKPVTVNGASVIAGATVLSGSTIETPDEVTASVNLGPLGSLDMSPNTRVTLEFGRGGYVKVTLYLGCVTLYTRKNVSGEIDTPQGTPIRKTDKKNGGTLEVCRQQAEAIGVAGATMGTGLGTTGFGAGIAAGGGGLFGLGTAATVSVLGGGGVITVVAIRGSNPSGSRP